MHVQWVDVVSAGKGGSALLSKEESNNGKGGQVGHLDIHTCKTV